MKENYNFTYKISQINIESGTFEVTYIPEDINLSQVTYNVLFRPIDYNFIVDSKSESIYKSQDEVPFDLHIENSLKPYIPIQLWKNQYFILNNIENINGSTGETKIDSTQYNLYYSDRLIILNSK